LSDLLDSRREAWGIEFALVRAGRVGLSCGMHTSMSTPRSFEPVTRRSFARALGAAAAGAAVARVASAQDSAPAPQVTLAFAGGAHVHTPMFTGTLKSLENVKVVRVWDHDPARAGALAAEFGLAGPSELDAIWADPAVQGVVIASETSRHRELVLAAAKARKHLFVEKPLGMTAKESAEMADAVAGAGVLFNTGFFMRTQPVNLFLREQIKAGSFGVISRVRAAYCQSPVLDGTFDGDGKWMTDPKQNAFGAFGDIGIHVVDLLVWLLGEVESLTAQVGAFSGRHPGCDEGGEALLRMKRGAIATAAAGWIDLDDQIRFQLSGTEGFALIQRGRLFFKSAKVAGADGYKPWTPLPPAPSQPLGQWVEAIAGQPRDLVPVREAADRVRLLEGAYRAAREGAWVKV
jgi:predicted dehydrogenase